MIHQRSATRNLRVEVLDFHLTPVDEEDMITVLFSVRLNFSNSPILIQSRISDFDIRLV